MNFINPPKNNSLEGKLLIASPSLNGSIFEKTLIFICAHDQDGAVGAVVNKNIGAISSTELIELLKIKKNKKVSKEYKINYGGPVEENKLFILSATQEQKDSFSVEPRLSLYTNAEGFLADVIKGNQKDDFMLIKGFCSWDANQLDEEIKENSWMLTTPEYNAIFSKKSSASWDKTIKSLGIKKTDTIVSYSGSA